MPIQRTDVWKEFRAEFFKLANEEANVVKSRDQYLRASSAYELGEVILHDKANPERGHYCLLEMPKHGIWSISSGISENFQERFRTLAERAGVVLGCPEGTEPEDFWLHSLFNDLLENRSELLFAAKKREGGVIVQ